ncbi:coiled-coil domain-containing protein 25 [Pyrus ussuriensis x Pyrus communis]|uniref:Coiled-coil domain-containing protein 25 n=1 Tax=Pyrus ussuriensis x Pyrus communis TaxID=2448454 RepID=A0A5N5FV47_9ROSA|nr:coiled-coil domain-containing protein 25 [Pyrus ussuriensis x Pyrus communis]
MSSRKPYLMSSSFSNLSRPRRKHKLGDRLKLCLDFGKFVRLQLIPKRSGRFEILPFGSLEEDAVVGGVVSGAACTMFGGARAGVTESIDCEPRKNESLIAVGWGFKEDEEEDEAS